MQFDRYAQVRNGRGFDILPFAEIPKKNTDRYEIYKRGVTRLDKVSYEYYGTADFAWLILQANPQYGSMEFDIPDTVFEVGDRAFMRCMALEKLTIPVSVKTWGNFVTYFCKNLSTFIYEGTKDQYLAIKCYPPLEKGEEQRVVNPNESLSMYLSIIATEVKCSDGSFDIKQILEDNGFMDAGNLNPDAGKTEDEGGEENVE